MENYKEAVKQKLRFQTSKGLLTLEQLFDLSLNDLDSLAVSLQDAYENSKGKSFLEKKTLKDKGLKLQFDIVLDVLNTKAEELDEAKTAAENKAHNAEILELIADKQKALKAGKSIKQLEAMLR